MEPQRTERNDPGGPQGGWFSYAALTGDNGVGKPLDDAYTRFTNQESFRPLHDWPLEAAARLHQEYQVVPGEDDGIDARLERAPLAGRR